MTEEQREYMRELGRRGGRNSLGKNPERANELRKIGLEKRRQAKKLKDGNGK